MSEQLIYHKKTFFPSSYLAAQFYNFNSEQIYFSSGNKLILFDVIKNQKIFRINLKGKKIIYFSQSDIDNDELFYKYRKDEQYLKKILAKGADNAREYASKKMKVVKEKVGLSI